MISFSPLLPSSWVLNSPYSYFFPSGCASLTWLGTPHSRPLSSSSHWQSSPSSLLPPPPSPFLAYFRSAPAAPSPLLPLLSLSTARPTHIRSPVVFLPAWCCPRYSTLFLVVSRFLHLLTSRLLMALPPPPPPLLPPLPLPGWLLLLLSYGPEVGVGVPPPSGVTTSLVNSTAMRVLFPLPLILLPPLGLPLTRLPPLSACASG